MKKLKFLASGLLAIFLFSSALFAQAVTPINQIQGDSNMSPLVGKEVTTRGIVTTLVKRGFYIQTPDSEIDENPKTSEGIYVFTNREIADVALGDLVEVSGVVTEYKPQNERYFLPLTEITNPKFKVISKDNPLPSAINLTTAELSPQGNIDQMEKFEGMRVKIDILHVVAPTGGWTNEKSGITTSDGIFFGVIAGTPRPFREPGLDKLKIFVDKLPNTISMFDMNPELLRIDTNSQINITPIDVTAGAVLKNLTGIVDYSRQTYTIIVDGNNPPEVEGLKTFIASSPAGEREVTVGVFNVENLFDDEKNSPHSKREPVSSKEHYQKKLKKISLSVRDVLSNPDVLAIVEVESLKVLQELADKINADEVAASKPNPEYKAYLEEGNDIRGIDVGYLVKSNKVKIVKTEQLAKEIDLQTLGANPDEKLYDRPPFLLMAEIDDEKTNQKFDFTVIVNHFKSYGGIDDPKDGERVRNKRRLQAEWLANFIAERAKNNPNERMLVTGDFNAFQFDDGFNDLVGILKGKSAANILTPSTTSYQTNLFALVDRIDARNRYSYVFNGSAQVLDHILVNRNALQRGLKFGYARLNADFPKIYGNDENRPERSSDHDAPVFYMSLDEIKRNQ